MMVEIKLGEALITRNLNVEVGFVDVGNLVAIFEIRFFWTLYSNLSFWFIFHIFFQNLFYFS